MYETLDALIVRGKRERKEKRYDVEKYNADDHFISGIRALLSYERRTQFSPKNVVRPQTDVYMYPIFRAFKCLVSFLLVFSDYFSGRYP